jgi:hypothetical protein
MTTTRYVKTMGALTGILLAGFFGWFELVLPAHAADLYTCSVNPDSNWVPSADGGQTSISAAAGTVSVGVMVRCTSSFDLSDGDGGFMGYTINGSGAEFGVSDGAQHVDANTDSFVWLRRSDSSASTGTATSIQRTSTGSIINTPLHGCVIRYTNSDQCSGNRDNHSGEDMIFRLSDTFQMDNVTTTLVHPINNFDLISTVVGVNAYSNVRKDLNSGLSPTLHTVVQKNSLNDCSGSWTDYATDDQPYDGYGVTVDGHAVYAFGGSPDPTMNINFVDGCYQAKSRTDFSGHPNGQYSGWNEFAIFSTAVAQAASGSWLNIGGTVGAEDWISAVNSIPSHDTTYGACKLWGISFNFLGTGTSETNAGDGLPCVWTWIQYAIIPPSTSDTFDFISLPIRTLLTRWPASYLTLSYTNFMAHLRYDTQCPIPTTGGETLLGTELPVFDLCSYASTATAAVTANSTVVQYLIIGLWIGLVGYSLSIMKEFFS